MTVRVILAIVALVGSTMFAVRARRRQSGAAAAETTAPGIPAPAHRPVSVVTLSGILAVTTVVLVLLAALDVGGS